MPIMEITIKMKKSQEVSARYFTYKVIEGDQKEMCQSLKQKYVVLRTIQKVLQIVLIR